MTTRAGTAGLLSGLLISVILLGFTLAWPLEFLNGITGLEAVHFWVAAGLFVILMIGGGRWAARRARAVRPSRAAALGALAGLLAGTLVFCLWGAAAAGVSSPIETMIYQTLDLFRMIFGISILLGAFGGWLACPRSRGEEETFDLRDPQMAMNAAITALPACVFTAALATAFTWYLSPWPLILALLLALIAHFALMLVVPHETRQAEHRCGTDEVKMAAFVSIAAAPVLALLLLLINKTSCANPLVVAALLVSLAMSLKSLQDLLKVVLPKRASFTAPDGKERSQAVLFGSIAESKTGRLIVLCTGCGLAMVLPVYVCAISIFINLNGTLEGMTYPSLFLRHTLAIGGMVFAVIAALSIIYVCYLRLARCFSHRN